MSIFAAQPDIDDRAVPAHPLTALRGEIEFRNLSFSYNGTPVLKNLNLRIPAGQTVAIVGATGSGKSTLVGLVPRLYDAPPGSLLLDGVPIRQIPLQTLRRAHWICASGDFPVQPNHPRQRQLRGAGRQATAVEQATEISSILPEIRDFPKGFDTLVGERGLTLSGGQKQRTAISRALSAIRISDSR